MRKLIFIPLLTFLLMLTGCNNDKEDNLVNDSSNKPASSSEETKSDTTSKPENTKTEGNTNSNNETSSTEENTESTDANTSTKENTPSNDSHSAPSTKEIISTIKSKLKMKNSKLPTKFPITDKEYITAKINKNESDAYSVSFYRADEYIPINDESLGSKGNATLIGTFQGTTYKNSTKQDQLFPVVSLEDIPADMAVDLGHHIKGMTEGAAGSSYLQWKEGRWIFQIKTLSSSSLNSADIAKKMVDYLEANSLPVPHENGRVEVSYPENAKNVEVITRFEDGNIVYTLETNEVPINALMMTVTTK